MKIKDLKKLTDLRFLNLYQLNYLDMKGNNKSWQFATRSPEPKCVTGKFSEPDAVVIVPYHLEQQKIVVIEEFRVPLAGYQFGFPAGLVDEGESVTEAAKRELKEETGLTLTRVTKVGPAVFSTSGMTDEAISMVYVECTGEADYDQNESSEDITVHYLSPEEAATLLADPSKKFDVKTWLVLSSFIETGKI